MIRTTLIAAILLAFSILPTKAQQLLDYELQRSFTLAELDVLVQSLPGASLVIDPAYEIDVYSISYLTPYLHPDSLKKATGALLVPRAGDCELPMIGYGHGTMSKRQEAPSIDIERSEGAISLLYASQGYLVAMPDYLGLGNSDTSIKVHPYITKFHQGNTTINMLRTARELRDTLGYQLSEQLFLSGYSQGGFTTVATQRIIEEDLNGEFTVTASAPGSGPYDIIGSQTETILTDSMYSAPMYLPYIILGYNDQYGLYDSLVQYLKPPYDSIMAANFYGMQVSSGTIDRLSNSVPKLMLQDTMLARFESDSTHPFRRALADNHMLDWTPQAPVKILYCRGDKQVNPDNATNALAAWTANGATDITIADLADVGHVDCAPFAFISALTYFNTFKTSCPVSVQDVSDRLSPKLYPNPTTSIFQLDMPEAGTVVLHDLAGKEVYRADGPLGTSQHNVDHLRAGIYAYTIITNSGYTVADRLVIY